VAGFKIRDGADEFRIEIVGMFANSAVREVEAAWKAALTVTAPRRHMVNISRMTGYDALGGRLLSMMYRHGMQFAAGTPESLVFLSEIAGPPRRGPVAVSNPKTAVKETQVAPLAPLSLAVGGR
jgi:hypothetical protein